MDDEVKANLFSSFFSTKMGKGTGIGLLITKKLIEEHDGSIEYTSQLGKGSTFTIKLPFIIFENHDDQGEKINLN